MEVPTALSWSPGDHLRHFAYRGIYQALFRYIEELDGHSYKVLDFASEWYGDPDGGWQTYMRGMLKTLVRPMEHVLATYPPHDVQRMPEYADASFDVAVVDNVLEHVERPWLAAAELRRVLRPGGVCVAMTPGLYPVHPSPLDCWRILPDGYRALFPANEWAMLTCDAWGSRDQLVWELLENGSFPDGPPSTTAASASSPLCYAGGADVYPSYSEGRYDGRFPLMVWWVGVRR